MELSTIEAPLRHLGTGRSAAVLRVEDFGRFDPVSVASSSYILVVASERISIHCTEVHARSWINAGASYVCAWGPASPSVEEAFDCATFLPALGAPLPFTLMTTSHKGEGLEEALWFAFYSAWPPDDFPHELETVIVVVDSAELEAKCLSWVLESSE